MCLLNITGQNSSKKIEDDKDYKVQSFRELIIQCVESRVAELQNCQLGQVE